MEEVFSRSERKKFYPLELKPGDFSPYQKIFIKCENVHNRASRINVEHMKLPTKDPSYEGCGLQRTHPSKDASYEGPIL